MTHPASMGRRKPTFREILKKVAERNETAAVDIHGRFGLGLLGLAGLIVILVFAPMPDKMLGLIFLIFPGLPAFFGVYDDFVDAKRELVQERSKVAE